MQRTEMPHKHKTTPVPSRAADPPWAKLSDEELLGLSLRDLGVTIRGTVLEQRTRQIYAELSQRDIRFRPHFWLSAEWFTPDGVPGVAAVRADLEDGSAWPFEPARFAGIVVANYLYRPLFRHLIDALAPGGVLIYETFMAGNERYGKPSNPEFLLAPGELLATFERELTVAAFEQGRVARPKAAMVQRLCALHGTASEVALEP